MKKTLLLAIALLPSLLQAQKVQMGTYLLVNVPTHSIMPKMTANAGFGLELAYRPVNRLPVLVSLKSGLGYYSRTTLPQTYQFDNGSTTNTDVQFTSYMNQVQLGAKCYIGSEAGVVRGFVTPQFGAAFMRTRILIMDPKENSTCNPLDRRAAHKYSGFTYGGEAGIETDMSRVFKKTVKTPGKHRMYASVNFTKGIGKFDYVNIKYMTDTPDNSADARGVNAAFSDGSTTIYEKKIAEVYTTNLQFVGFTVGYTYSF